MNNQNKVHKDHKGAFFPLRGIWLHPPASLLKRGLAPESMLLYTIYFGSHFGFDVPFSDPVSGPMYTAYVAIHSGYDLGLFCSTLLWLREWVYRGRKTGSGLQRIYPNTFGSSKPDKER